MYHIEARWMLDPAGRVKKDQLLVIENNKFTYVGDYKSDEIPQGSEKIRYDKGLIVPPFINAHTHIPMSLFRGIVDDESLQEWLRHIWTIEPKLTPHDIKIGTELAMAEMLASGTVGFVDQYYYANEIAEVTHKTGMKAFLGPSIFNNNGETKTVDDSFKKNMEVLNKWHKKDGRILVGFGPHAPYSVDDEMYIKIYEQAEKYDTKIHTHLSESPREVEDSKAKTGLTPIAHMDKIGVLDRIIAAHCVNLEEADFKLLKDNDVTVLHNIQSNLKLGSGIADIPRMLDEGINVTLGTDGNASNNNLDLLEEVRLTVMLHRGIHNNPKQIDTYTAFKMGTVNAAKLLPDVYSGRLETGQPADLVVVDMDKVNTIPVINPLSNYVFSANTNNIAITMSDGKILYQEGRHTTIDVDRVREETQKSIDRMMLETNYTAVEFEY